MGYTHYWGFKRLPVGDEWQQIRDVTAEIVLFIRDQTTIVLSGGDHHPKPEISLEHIWINGSLDESYEDFILSPEDTGYNFCKTAQKPYDLAVSAILQAISMKLPDVFNFTSDGDSTDLASGKVLAEAAVAGNLNAEGTQSALKSLGLLSRMNSPGYEKWGEFS